jgi:hypothetical protein
MPVAILVGIPTQYFKRIHGSIDRGLTAYRPGWNVEYVPANRSTPGVFPRESRSALERAEKCGGAHLIGVSKQDRETRQSIEADLRCYFRFRWLDNRLLSYIGSHVPSFVDGFNVILAEEEMWAEKVKPQDYLSPLILPELCFESSHPAGRLWQLAEQYGELGNVLDAARTVEIFREKHWLSTDGGGRRRRRWVDTSDRVFDHTGERHGRPPFPREWKYSYRIPDGFHFDVTILHRRPFVFTDSQGNAHPVDASKNVNVDPHGIVRG